MSAFASRGIALTILLAALCFPTGARAQAPVVSSKMLRHLTPTIWAG